MIKKIINAFFHLPLILLVLTYGWHGIAGLLMGEEYMTTVAVFGLNHHWASILVLFTGLLDASLSILLLFKNMLFPSLPWKWLFLYAGLWPIIPRVLQWMGGDNFAWMEIFIFISVATLAYCLQIKKENNIAIALPPKTC